MHNQRIQISIIFTIFTSLIINACSAPGTPASAPSETSLPTNPPPPTQTSIPPDTPTPTSKNTLSPTLPVATSPTTSKESISVEADGSGDFPTLAEAVQNAPEGATLLLGAGMFQLDEALEIDKPLSLLGKGIDQTEIVSSAAEYTVHVKANGAFSVEGITFKHEGSAFADAVEVEEGQITFKSCRFSGGVINPEGKQRGSGLRLREATTGVVQDCVAEENFTGFWILAEEATLENNLSTRNKAGIAFGANSKALARYNQVEKNEYNGFVVAMNANPTLEENTSINNGNNGFIFMNEATGIAIHNVCESNEFSGMYIGEQAAPKLEENLCTKNNENGFLFEGSSAGEAKYNQCSENKATGIGVKGDAQPVLESNICNDNAIYGIIIAENAQVKARGNECNNNQKSGILVADSAQATLEENSCSKNTRFGIAVGINAVAVLRQNECNENVRHGILVAENATATLEGNICSGNTQAGIAFIDNSSGTAAQNQCTGNETGIYVENTANPELLDNDCHDNSQNDILDER